MKLRNFKGALYRDAVFDRSAVSEETRSAELSFSSEAGVSRWGEMEYLSHDETSVDLQRLTDLGVLLFNHDANQPVGSIKRVWLDKSKKKCRAEVQFDRDTASDVIFQKVLSGTLRGVSVGYVVRDWEQVKVGAKSTDKRFKGPCYVARSWEPLEVSVVSVPADASVGVGRSFEEDNEGRDPEMDKEQMIKNIRSLAEKLRSEKASTAEMFRAAVAAVVETGGGSVDDFKAEIDEEAARFTAAATPPAAKPEGGAPAGDAAARAAELAERQRGEEIRAMEREFDLDLSAHISSGATVEEVRKVVLTELAKRRAPIANAHVGEEESAKFRAAARDALLIRSGQTVKAPAAGAEDVRGYRLERLAEECLARHGDRIPQDPREMVGRALTTTDLPVILGDVARLSLLDGWTEAPETYLNWVDDTGSCSDFKENKGARPGEMDPLLEIPESGEYKYGSMGEESEKWHIATYGRMFKVTRQALINDSLGALTDIPRRMGQEAKRKLGDIAYAPLLGNEMMGDGTVLFHANHNNLQTAAAFSFDNFEATIGALATMELAMANQKGVDKKHRLNIQAVYIIAPVALKLAVTRFLAQTSTPLNVDTAKNTATGSAANPYAGVFIPVFDARLDDVSSTAFYLAAAKGKTVKMYYLNGIKDPYLEQKDGWNMDGTEFKVRIDAGSKAMDWRGLQKNPGK